MHNVFIVSCSAIWYFFKDRSNDWCPFLLDVSSKMWTHVILEFFTYMTILYFWLQSVLESFSSLFPFIHSLHLPSFLLFLCSCFFLSTVINHNQYFFKPFCNNFTKIYGTRFNDWIDIGINDWAKTKKKERKQIKHNIDQKDVRTI